MKKQKQENLELREKLHKYQNSSFSLSESYLNCLTIIDSFLKDFRNNRDTILELIEDKVLNNKELDLIVKMVDEFKQYSDEAEFLFEQNARLFEVIQLISRQSLDFFESMEFVSNITKGVFGDDVWNAKKVTVYSFIPHKYEELIAILDQIFNETPPGKIEKHDALVINNLMKFGQQAGDLYDDLVPFVLYSHMPPSIEKLNNISRDINQANKIYKLLQRKNYFKEQIIAAQEGLAVLVSESNKNPEPIKLKGTLIKKKGISGLFKLCDLLSIL